MRDRCKTIKTTTLWCQRHNFNFILKLQYSEARKLENIEIDMRNRGKIIKMTLLLCQKTDTILILCQNHTTLKPKNLEKNTKDNFVLTLKSQYPTARKFRKNTKKIMRVGV